MTYEINDIPAEQHAHELADQEESDFQARYKAFGEATHRAARTLGLIS